MTPSEVNKGIALRRGWADQFGYALPPYGKKWPLAERLGLHEGNWPDYCGSWELAGQLLEEMGAELPALCCQDNQDWMCSAEYRKQTMTEVGATPTEAIARAWLARKELAKR